MAEEYRCLQEFTGKPFFLYLIIQIILSNLCLFEAVDRCCLLRACNTPDSRKQYSEANDLIPRFATN